MTNPKRWLDELPLESHERELLLVGKAARPAEGTLEVNWQALSAALGAAAASSTVVSGVAAQSVSASAKVGSSLVASKAAGTGLLLIAAKSLALGVVVGLAVMGGASMAERAIGGGVRAATPQSVRNPRAPAALPAPTPFAAPTAAPLAADSLASASSPSATVPGSSLRARSLANGAASTLPASRAPATSTLSAEERTASLSRQARELAELKHLIDNGATTEALRRLDEIRSTDAASVLAEERDALQVQALARAQRRPEARAAARRFLLRYPASPYFETMRQLLTEE
ncbi:MAG TPA: hypothetical protein VER12_03795 [Polyangiaceae bacterium]|nr:hypothetical protein [Polyangiaceae bacterium]